MFSRSAPLSWLAVSKEQEASAVFIRIFFLYTKALCPPLSLMGCLAWMVVWPVKSSPSYCQMPQSHAGKQEAAISKTAFSCKTY